MGRSFVRSYLGGLFAVNMVHVNYLSIEEGTLKDSVKTPYYSLVAHMDDGKTTFTLYENTEFSDVDEKMSEIANLYF